MSCEKNASRWASAKAIHSSDEDALQLLAGSAQRRASPAKDVFTVRRSRSMRATGVSNLKPAAVPTAASGALNGARTLGGS